MSSSISSETSKHQPNALPVPRASMPVRRESRQGSLPGAQSNILPLLRTAVSLQDVGLRQFDGVAGPVIHDQPSLTSRSPESSAAAELLARIRTNDREFVQQLPGMMKKPADLDRLLATRDPKTGRTPSIAALIGGHLDLAVDLFLLGARPAGDGLHQNASAEAVEGDGMAAMLLHFMRRQRAHQSPSGQPADRSGQKVLDKIDRDTGHTLLTWAITRRHDALVELLIDSGADARAGNRFRNTPLEEACSSGSFPAVCRLLQALSESDTALRPQEVVNAISCAVEADRPMVLAQLLSFFRNEHRCPQGGRPDIADEPSLNPVASNPMTQRDAHAFFLGSLRLSSSTMDVLFDRTTDHFLLTERESLLLHLDKIVAWAEKENKAKIVEIIRAHAKLPIGL